LKAFRHFIWLVLLAALAARPAAAAPEVHRFNLMLSGIPSQLTAKDLNNFIDDYNNTVLTPRGLESLSNISFGWYFQAELRYFIRPSWAVSAGIGQIHSKSSNEYLPRISQAINQRVEIITVPVHLAGTYYLAPFTQGDFQARAYLGAGFTAATNSKIVLERLEFATDSATTLGGSVRSKTRGEGPGYYLEVGGHMFFASRYSVMIGVMYRSAIARHTHVINETVVPGGTGTVSAEPSATPGIPLDSGGLGLRMGLGIGF
jgi:hypothetical protein